MSDSKKQNVVNKTQKPRAGVISKYAQELIENAWIAGQKAAYRNLLSLALKGLETDGDEARWVAERHDAIVALRSLCKSFNLDNTWPDDTYLADVINRIELKLELRGLTDYGK